MNADHFANKRRQKGTPNSLRARRLGVDTQYEAIVFMRKDCPICRSEGFTAHTRILLSGGGKEIVATLYQITGDLISHEEAALSEAAWQRLGLCDGDWITIKHAPPLDSLRAIRSRIYGNNLERSSFQCIVQDVVDGRYSDLHLASFITACSARPLDRAEILALTQAMVSAGDRLKWPAALVVDKHCVGGLPGNRTSPIVVAIVASLGLTMPKTSSRAITSPAGTADVMETIAPVDLDVDAIRSVVEQEGGCVVWGGAVRLSPADDIFIRVERALDLDAEGQLIASVLSKKIAAGATHLVLDVPVGATAKVRGREAAENLAQGLLNVAEDFGLKAQVVLSDGSQPVGKGIGPALEARDVLAVLRCNAEAPADLRRRAITLAGAVLELAAAASPGQGEALATMALDDGRAWAKFQRICEAQGGMRTPPSSRHRRALLAPRPGWLGVIDNRRIARLAKLAGAPDAKAAGVELHAKLGDLVVAGQPLCTVHAEAPGELAYALEYATANPDILVVEDQ
jgi:thymidine phosphorylase